MKTYRILLTVICMTVFFTVIQCEDSAPYWDRANYGGAPAVQNKPITVYRSASCGCCKQWISHLQRHGFVVSDNIVADMSALKKEHGIGEDLSSCHTAIVDGYLIEGHVPAQDIVQLIHRRPADIAGLTVPAMPVGTPGMEDARSGRKDAFNVMSFSKNGQSRVYRRYENY